MERGQLRGSSECDKIKYLALDSDKLLEEGRQVLFSAAMASIAEKILSDGNNKYNTEEIASYLDKSLKGTCWTLTKHDQLEYELSITDEIGTKKYYITIEQIQELFV